MLACWLQAEWNNPRPVVELITVYLRAPLKARIVPDEKWFLFSTKLA